MVRSLGKAGFGTIIGRARGREVPPAVVSRYSGGTWLHPQFDDTAAFDRELAAFADAHPNLCAIFPVAEPSMRAILSSKTLGGRSIEVAMVRPQLFEACTDKSRGNELAKESGLLVPESLTVTDFHGLLNATRSIGFPLILKSLNSEREVHGRKAYVVNSREHFEVEFPNWPAGHRAIIVQEFVEGHFETCDFVACNGVLTGYLEAHVDRTDMVDGTGGGVEFESAPPSPDVLAAIRAFIEKHGYSGPGVIQFIRRKQTGELLFLENNPRLAACVEHTIQSGVDCPLLTLQSTTSVAGSPAKFDPDSCTFGHRLYWLERDLNSWMWKRAEFRDVSAGTWLRLIWQSLRKTDGGMYWEWGDPLPALLVYFRCAGLLLRRCARAITSWVGVPRGSKA